MRTLAFVKRSFLIVAVVVLVVPSVAFGRAGSSRGRSSKSSTNISIGDSVRSKPMQSSGRSRERSNKPSINISIGDSGRSRPAHSRGGSHGIGGSRGQSKRRSRYDDLRIAAKRPRYKSRSTELKTSLPNEPRSSFSFNIGDSSRLSRRKVNVDTVVSSVKSSGARKIKKAVTVIEHKPRPIFTRVNEKVRPSKVLRAPGIVRSSKVVTVNRNRKVRGGGKKFRHHNYKPYQRIRSSSSRIHYLDKHHWCNCGRFHLVRWSPSSSLRLVYFGKGISFGVSYIYPEYHRKYMFVSVGGHRPIDRRYRRYYRYGCHPGRWYGTYPQEYPVVENTTYNINNYYESAPNAGVVDSPAKETAADRYFDRAVEAFEAGNYTRAIGQIRRAIGFAPQDEILPFTLAQAYFADGQYTDAALVLRETFGKMPRDKETIYYPRGLYADQEVLAEQIELLEAAAEVKPLNGDVNLLMAYHRLGMGELDMVAGQLEKAAQDDDNAVAVVIMSDLLGKAMAGEAVDLELDN